MHEVIVSPFLGNYLLVRPGSRRGVKAPRQRYAELAEASAGGLVCPDWLAATVRQTWQVDLDGRRVRDVVLVRRETAYGFGRASYELNLGCNYDCEHCYLGLKRFEGLSWPDRERMLHMLRDAGVLWLQLTGGEPLIDKLFPDVYRLASDLGMMLTISTNGSRLANPAILGLLTSARPYEIVVSVYGATEASYDGLTRRKGSFRKFRQGLAAAHEAGLPLHLNLIVARHNADEVDQMRALAGGYQLPYDEYTNISPTIYGGAETLPAQSSAHLRARKPFTGCNAGHTFFHVDPHGKASICKVGRDPHVDLLTEGVDGLVRLGGIADGLLARQTGCSGCTLSGTCGTCMPLVTLYRKAAASPSAYCQHSEGR